MAGLTDFTGRAIEIVRQAIAEDNAGNYEAAFRLYLKAMDWFEKAVEYEKNPKAKASIKAKMMEYLKRAEELKEHTQNAQKKTPVLAGSSSSSKSAKQGEDKEDDMSSQFSQAVVIEKPNVKWDDVAGLETAKSILHEAVILPIKFPQLFTGKRRPWRGILLYGPPGTGKSYLAKAVATEVDSTFLSVSSADLVSKYLGESERAIRGLFEYARKHRPAVIFIDEIDSLATNRSAGEHDATRRIKTELLVQMQGVGNDNDNILVLGATNTPWEIDPAIRRRLEKRIYIPLPAAAARAQMFKLNVGNTPNSLTDDDYRRLGELSEGFSGSDISVLVRDALMEPLRTCQLATHFKQVPNPSGGPPLYEPCSPSEPGAEAKTLMELQSEQLSPPIVTMRDFEKCLLHARPTVAPEDLTKQEEWTQQFGQDG